MRAGGVTGPSAGRILASVSRQSDARGRDTSRCGAGAWRVPVLGAWLAAAALLGGCHNFQALPDGLSVAAPARGAAEVRFVADRTWVDGDGVRHVDQAIFDAAFALIDGARQLIVADMFLFNDWQGPVPETTRALSGELTERLIAARRAHPGIEIVVITDPVNTLYGGIEAPHFEALRAAGVRVVVTDLTELRDSNVLYSPFWRVFFQPFGNARGRLLPNPIGPGRVSLRTYLALLNFKANHRKTLVADRDGALVGLVSSANPHDASSAHRNAAIIFDGPAARDLLQTENAVLAFSGAEPVDLSRWTLAAPAVLDAPVTVQVVTEGAIEAAVLAALERAGMGDRIDLMMFYLSDRDVIDALLAAQARGATLRVLLDPNKDAFGREKNGVPNRPVARRLRDAGIDVRWCDSHGEQCHAKMLLVRDGGGATTLISGSANFTRRNLDDFNLETDVVVKGDRAAPPLAAARRYFDGMWANRDGRHYSTGYEAYREDGLWHRFLYCWMESTGMSSF